MAAPVLVLSGPVGVGKTTIGRLIASAFEPSAHVRVDDFTAFVVNAGSDAAPAASPRRDDVVGAAVASAAMRFAEGGYTVVLDGHLFPDGVDAMAEIFAARTAPLHYAVLRADLATCIERAVARGLDSGHFPFDEDAVTALHERFTALGKYEGHAFDATTPPEDVAEAVLAAFASGRIAVLP